MPTRCTLRPMSFGALKGGLGGWRSCGAHDVIVSMCRPAVGATRTRNLFIAGARREAARGSRQRECLALPLAQFASPGWRREGVPGHPR